MQMAELFEFSVKLQQHVKNNSHLPIEQNILKT
jgi:hypothetical protein